MVTERENVLMKSLGAWCQMAVLLDSMMDEDMREVFRECTEHTIKVIVALGGDVSEWIKPIIEAISQESPEAAARLRALAAEFLP